MQTYAPGLPWTALSMSVPALFPFASTTPPRRVLIEITKQSEVICNDRLASLRSLS